jgi:hypothetical protein
MNKTLIAVVLILVAAYFVADYISPLNRCIRNYVEVNPSRSAEGAGYITCTGSNR